MTATVIQPAQLKELLATGHDVRILDVRTPAEFESSHIRGAANIPVDSLSQLVDDLAGLDKPVVVVCQSGQRAGRACGVLREAGLPDVQLLEGGIAAWEKVGGEVDRGEPRWALERQIRLVAGLVVLAAVVASIWLPWMKWVGAAIGLGLTVAALTNTCAMGMMLMKLPYNKGVSHDPDLQIAKLHRTRVAS